MVSYVHLFKKIPNYNPPELYINIDTIQQYQTMVSENVVKTLSVRCSINNHIGTVKVPIDDSFDPSDITIIGFADDITHFYYIGTVKSMSMDSTSTISYVYDIDWFTSQKISALLYAKQMPTADTILYRRLMNGEFSFKSEGIMPLNTKSNKIDIKLTAQLVREDLFVTSYSDLTTIMIYHESETDKDIWMASQPYGDRDRLVSCEEMFGELKSHHNLKEDVYKFNPKGVVYYGYTNINFLLLPNYEYWGNSSYQTHNIILNRLTYWQESYTSNDWYIATSELQTATNNEYSLQFGRITPTEQSRLKLLDTDGSEIYEFPLGIQTPTSIPITIGYSTNENAPSIVFKLPFSNYINNQDTITIPFKQLMYFVDNLQVYNAEEKVYASEMRNLQTLNNLVSGITGAATQGAMVYGFSRNTTMSPTEGDTFTNSGNASYKGKLAGLVGMAGALATAGYEYLYANNKASEIDSIHAKSKADTMLMASSGCFATLDVAGLYRINYDSTTITAINNYHNRYGYATNKVESNRLLTSFNGYVKADIVMQSGLRKDVENYIINMFAHGVWFT